MRSFVSQPRLNRSFVVRSTALVSLIALIGAGCGGGDALSHGEEGMDQAMGRLDGTSNAGEDPPPPPPPFPGPMPPPLPADNAVPTTYWKFDDCQATSTTLADASSNGVVASRAQSASCAQGIDGAAISFDQKADIVEAPNHPALALSQNLAVAAWVKPVTVSGISPIVQKRTTSKLSFSLGIDDGEAVIKVTLASGEVVTSRAPVSANEWTHVAGLYDGKFLFLFLNGQQVGQVSAAGSLQDVSAPVRVGSNGANQRFKGIIDEVWLSTNPLSPPQVAALSCINTCPRSTSIHRAAASCRRGRP